MLGIRLSTICFLALISSSASYSQNKVENVISEFNLTESDLSKVDPGGEDTINMQEKADKVLKFSLIDKATFEKARKQSSLYFIEDTINTSSKKHNGVLKLKTAKGYVKYTDGPDTENGGEDTVINQYCGEYPILNKYIIFRPLFESDDYYLVDKTSGKETGFISFPLISPNRKYITNIAEYMEPNTVFDIYTIKSDSLTPIIETWFKNWLPVESGQPPKNDMFWGKDGYLYIKVRNAKYDMSECFNPIKDCQYIKIKVVSTP